MGCDCGPRSSVERDETWRFNCRVRVTNFLLAHHATQRSLTGTMGAQASRPDSEAPASNAKEPETNTPSPEEIEDDDKPDDW